MRSAIRPLSAVLSAAILASCVDAFGTAPVGGAPASLSIVPRFSPSAMLASATLAEAGLEYNRVRVVIIRPESDTLKDTTVVFTPSSPEITLELSIAAIPSELLDATVQFRQDNTVIFSGTRQVRALPPASAATAAPAEIAVTYTGPGSTATSVNIQPGGGVYSSSTTTQFTAKAFDGSSAEVSNTPFSWKVSDGSQATISATGLLTPKVQRGTVQVTATAPTGASKTITVNMAPAAIGVRVVQGAGQKAPPGQALPLPVVVELYAADGGPAAGGLGQTVTFSAGAGATITPASAQLDANSRATAEMKVGPNAGRTYVFTAKVGGDSVTWAGIAAAGPPTHFVPSGSTTLVLQAGVVPDEIPTLRLVDDLDNSVPGQALKVTITRQEPASVTSFSVLSDDIGLLEVYRVAPTIAGAFTVKVEADPQYNVPPITYDVTINPGPAAKLAFTQQPSTAQANQPMSPAVKVEVFDNYDNRVTAASGTVSIAVDPATGGGVTQVGTGSVTMSGGVALFTNLRFSAARNGVKLTVSGLGLPTVFSAPFNITP